MPTLASPSNPPASGAKRLGWPVAPAARALLAAGLRCLPYLFGERGQLHATWRAHHWAPDWLHAGACDIGVRRQRIRWQLDLRDNVQRSLYYTGSYEPHVQALLRDALPAHGVFVDVGAHIGAHALPLARHLLRTEGTVLAFEPAPDNAHKLRGAARCAGLSNLHIVQSALGSRAGSMTLRASTSFGIHDTGVRSRFGDGAPAYDVPVQVFDQWERHHQMSRIDAVKIDVEGAELDVLIGMEQSLQRFRPGLVVIESLDANRRAAGVEATDIMAFLHALDYVQAPGPVEKNAVFAPSERQL